MIDRIDVLGTEEARQMFADIGRQAPFALAGTLNDLANLSQKRVKDSLGERFTLRRPKFVRDTIYRKTGEDWANKEKLEAAFRVNDQFNFLAKFEEGGTNKAREGRFLALPVDVRRTKKDLITDKNKPAALLQKKSVRISNRVILQTTGKVKSKVTKMLYLLIRSARIEPRLGMALTSKKVVEQEFDRVATKNITNALRTAK